MKIERRADALLEEVGVDFRGDPETLALWREAGAAVEGERVRIPAELARSLCAKAPREFEQLARNPRRSVRIGGRHCVFAPVYGPPFVRCLEQGRRYGTIEDFRNLVRLTLHAALAAPLGAAPPASPATCPSTSATSDMVYAHIRWSDKPFLGSITEISRCEDSVEMARILFGAETLERSCVIMGNINANSPLMFDKVATHAIRTYCGANQGIVIAPFILGGAMGPVTTAGALAQALAEGMAGVGLSQLARPGAPVVLGNFLSSMSAALRRAHLRHAGGHDVELRGRPARAAPRGAAALRRLAHRLQGPRRAGRLRERGQHPLDRDRRRELRAPRRRLAGGGPGDRIREADPGTRTVSAPCTP